MNERLKSIRSIIKSGLLFVYMVTKQAVTSRSGVLIKDTCTQKLKV